MLRDAGVSVVLAQEEFAAVLKPLLKSDGCNASIVDLAPAAPGKARGARLPAPPRLCVRLPCADCECADPKAERVACPAPSPFLPRWPRRPPAPRTAPRWTSPPAP